MKTINERQEKLLRYAEVLVKEECCDGCIHAGDASPSDCMNLMLNPCEGFLDCDNREGKQ